MSIPTRTGNPHEAIIVEEGNNGLHLGQSKGGDCPKFSVPDSGATALMLGAAFVALLLFKRVVHA
jgi:protein with PEP-CTERM/exosortase system signal